jgi:hypothetical protein
MFLFSAVRPPKRIVIDERERLALAQSLKVKAMDALKVCKYVIDVIHLLELLRLAFNLVPLFAALWTEAADQVDSKSTRFHCSPSQQ